MKRLFALFVLICAASNLAAAQAENQKGTIIRMTMAECIPSDHGFMIQMSGGVNKAESGQMCPEYVLVADKVVYAISGKGSEAMLPLAETTHFRLQKNEMLIRVDDASKESHFRIKAMILRADWEREHPAADQDMQVATGGTREATVRPAAER